MLTASVTDAKETQDILGQEKVLDENEKSESLKIEKAKKKKKKKRIVVGLREKIETDFLSL